MTTALPLYEIQVIELEIIDHTKRINSITAQLQDDAALRQAKDEYAAAAAALAENRKQFRAIEAQIEAAAGQSKAIETRLYSGKVSNTKELQDMQKAIESLAGRRANLDDQLLQVMIDQDQVSQDEEACQQSLQQAQAIHNKVQKDLRQEKTQLERKVESLKSERKMALAKAPEAALRIYSNMRRAKNNRVVAILQGKTCAVCGIAQDNSVLAAIRRGEGLVNCSNCGRILLQEKYAR